jgi:2-dehydropantoate 2-reductase
MKITVIGSGAMGSLFGGLLSKNGKNSVLLVDTWPEHVQKINSDGLEVRGDQGIERIQVRAAFPTEVIEQADLVIVFTKSQNTRGALESVKHIFKPETMALTLQNGLGNVERLAEYIPLEQIIVGTTTNPCDILEPGVIQSKGGGETKILSADSIKRKSTDSVAAELNEAGLHCMVVEDIYVSIWEKVAFNCAMNALCGVTRLTVGGIGDVKEGYGLAIRIVEETIAVANRKGIKADLKRCKQTVNMAFVEHKDHKPSMLQDILAERPTEIESINGAVAREAKKLGMETPVTSVLADLVSVIQKNFGGTEK